MGRLFNDDPRKVINKSIVDNARISTFLIKMPGYKNCINT